MIPTSAPLPLQERDDIVAALVDAAGGASTATGGRILVLEGPPGIGKTRLLAELRDHLWRRDRPVLTARASTLDQEITYGVVRQWFGPLLRAAPPARRARLLAGAAGQAAPVFDARPGAAAPVGDLAVLHGLYRLVVNLCAEDPQVLVVDDVQHADAPTLRLLAYLVPRLDGLPLTVVLARTAGALVPGTLAEVLQASATRLFRPAPLSPRGAAALLAMLVGTRPDPAFGAACHELTGGNPLLLAELARHCREHGITPDGTGAAQVSRVRLPVLSGRIAAYLAALPADILAVAHAVALLDTEADLPAVAAVAGRTVEEAATAAECLIRAQVLVRADDGRLRYPHQLLRASALEPLTEDRRAAGHRAAARHLVAVGAEPERIAAHLIATTPGAVPDAARHLGRAADTALGRGSPQNAYTYLRRALAETTGDRPRRALLDRLADVALHSDVAAAAGYAEQALTLTTGAPDRAAVGLRLGEARLLQGDTSGAVAAWRAAQRDLDDADTGLRDALDAYLINVTVLEPGRLDLLTGTGSTPAGDRDGAPTVGGRALDCVRSLRAAFELRPAAAALARRGLADGLLIRHDCGDSPLVCGWLTLLAAEDDAATDSLARARHQAYRRGSIRAYGPVHAFAALDQLWRGDLAEAEREARAAVEAVERSGVRLGRPFVAPILADVLAERGDLAGAAAALAWAGLPEEPPHSGPMYLYTDSRARLLRRTGAGERALAAALDAGRRFARFGGDNPAIVPWRTEAARTLHRTGRSAEAAELALAEVALARTWGAPRPLGRALRVAGTVLGPHDGFPALSEAVDVLAGSSARLEYAKALLALGAAAVRRDQPRWARELLEHAATLAAGCDCPPLLDRVRAVAAAAGARPVPGGGAVLTAGEWRVAELAAAGRSNREIAEALFVTPKTVELHLTNTYRKLGITGRVQLVGALAAATPARAGSRR